MGMLLRRRAELNTQAQGVTKLNEVTPSVSPETSKETETVETDTDLSKMNGTQLRKLAKSKGIKNVEELTAKELKSILSKQK